MRSSLRDEELKVTAGPKPFVVAAILLFALAGAAHAQGIRVTIDRAQATLQDQLVLSVTVDGSQNAVPELPDLSAFQQYSQGQQRQINMVNGVTSVSITYNVVLIPKRAGTFNIGPAKVVIGGRTYQSKPFQVRILDAQATPAPQENDNLFVTASVSNDKPYVGEQVLYTWRFFRRVQVTDAQFVEPFNFEGFLAEDLGDVKEYRTVRGGQEFLVSELRKALFPQEQGTLTLPATQLRCEIVVRSRGRRGSLFDDFFGRTQTQAMVLRTRPIDVHVRPLPAAPAGFSGLVGDFKIASSLSKRDLAVGESATWKLTVSGTGNVQMIGEPPLSGLEAFKVYDDKPASSIERSGVELSGSKSFTKALVPLEDGSLTVPAVRLTYFDPKAGSYRTSSTPPIPLAVKPAEGKEELRLTESVAPTTGKVAVRILADDILPIYKDLGAVTGRPFGHRPDPVFFAGLLAPPFFFFGLLFVERRRRHLEVNVDLVRRRSALKKAMKCLGEVEKKAKAGENRAAMQLASRVLREYVGDKVALEGSAFTPADAAAQLGRCGVDEGAVAETCRLLEGFEAAQYAGIGAEESAHLASELRPLLKKLERQIRR